MPHPFHSGDILSLPHQTHLLEEALAIEKLTRTWECGPSNDPSHAMIEWRARQSIHPKILFQKIQMMGFLLKD